MFALGGAAADMPSEVKTVVILLGPPGSGKGTQARAIAKTFDIPHISTGEILRDEMKRETPLGVEVRHCIDLGRLVPDALITDILFNRISRSDAIHGYLLDGFPRTIPQAEALDTKLGSARLFVIYLDVPDEVVVQRISGRLTCASCGQIYNRYFEPPKNPEECDRCHGELVQRADDKEDVVRERLTVYRNETAPLIDYYHKKGVLITIDGTLPPDQVESAIQKRLH